MQQPLYGLIGGKLGHSYSKIIHEKIADYTYELLPLPTEAEARTFMEKRAFAAINVTIPYKQFVIPYCDVVDPKAQAIGAVNTIVNRDGKLYGYNTDYAGFAYLAGAHGVDFAGKTVLILGTGGTHSTVTAVCRDGGAKEILTASRTGKGDALLYSEAMHRPDVQIIVNTTPCGMFPNVGQCLIDPKAFPALEAVLDVVYNPFRTELLLRAEDCGGTAAGGVEMLVAQAVFATEHFTGRQLDTAAIIPAVSRELRHQLANVSIIGMPGCGKSTLGAALAKRLDKKFVDLDAEIERRTGHNIPDIFAQEGEDAFRRYEVTSLGHLAASTTVVSISSAMPWAILAMTLAVAGATRTTSAFLASEMWVTSNLKSRSKVSTMHLWPVSVSKTRGVMKWVAFSVIRTSTSDPSFLSALATFAIL